MSEAKFQTPERVVREFIRAMHDWEVDAYRRYKVAIFDETDHEKILQASSRAGEERKGVVARYCTTTERYPAPFGHPPQYDPLREEIVEVYAETPERVEVLTKYVYPEQYIDEKRRYEVVLMPDGWKIDDRKILSDNRWYSLI
jgi:hypothetical protein